MGEKMKVGIGYCNEKEAFLSGREVAEKAIKKGKIQRPDFAFAFCSGFINHDEFFRGLQYVMGDEVPIIGGSAIGIITNNNLSYGGYPAGAAVVQLDKLHYRIATAGNLNRGEKNAGRK